MLYNERVIMVVATITPMIKAAANIRRNGTNGKVRSCSSLVCFPQIYAEKGSADFADYAFNQRNLRDKASEQAARISKIDLTAICPSRKTTAHLKSFFQTIIFTVPFRQQFIGIQHYFFNF